MEIRLLAEEPESSREVAICGAPIHTIAELIVALGLPADCAGLWIDDKWASADSNLDDVGVVDGAQLRTHPTPKTGEEFELPEASSYQDRTDLSWSVEIIGGIQAGARFAISPSNTSPNNASPSNARSRTDKPLVAGAAPTCDIAISGVGWRPQQAQLQLVQEPSTQELIVQVPTQIPCQDAKLLLQQPDSKHLEVHQNTPVRLANALLQVSRTPNDKPTIATNTAERTTSGQITFNRPPRPVPSPSPHPIQVPTSNKARPARPAAFGWATLAAPLLMGLIMALLYNPYMALFALLSPLMMGASWVDGRRRNRTEAKHSRRNAQASLAQFKATLHRAHQDEITRLRQAHPHLAEIARRISQPSVRLWERRAAHSDFMSLMIGHGTCQFEPELICDSPQINTATTELLQQLGPLNEVPIVCDLGPGKVLGLTGHRNVTTAIARGLLVQAACLHGPSDLTILLASSDARMPAWAWTSWLPHTRAPAMSPARLIAQDRATLSKLVTEITTSHNRQTTHNWPHLLILADGENLTTGRAPPLRPLLQQATGPTSTIVLAPSLDLLPTSTTTIIDAPDASGVVQLSKEPALCHTALASGMSLKLARSTARKLARYEDPEQLGTDSDIPNNVTLLDLLNRVPQTNSSLTGTLSTKTRTGKTQPDDTLTNTLTNVIAARWQHNASFDSLAAPIGADGHGTVIADLTVDGPHALIGGTTGSGKSELLRTLVTSLASSYSPEQLNFVLVDYKGGSAFDICASLPHVVGLVTDLDDHLAERALRCLEAELRHREQLLRDHGASDLAHYRSLSSQASNISPKPTSPLARLVVIIDEFAALANELPTFMDALVNIAQRGRSLGMHLVLATQRPAGAINANIRTNTALRIALRVLDPADSADILDSPNAAAIARNLPGRAIARFGPGELQEFQSALVSSHSSTHKTTKVIPAPDGIPTVDDVADIAAICDTSHNLADNPPSSSTNTSDLHQVLTATVAAWQAWGASTPRQPWPDPLPTTVGLRSLEQCNSAGVAFALADDPNAQHQYPLIWDPTTANLLLVGNTGSGTTPALGTLAVALAKRYSPHECHLYVIGSNTQELRSLANLPHCGAVVCIDERDRIRRLIDRLQNELEHRLISPPATTVTNKANEDEQISKPRVVTLIDNWGALAKNLNNVADHSLLAALERIWVEGLAAGLCMIATTDQLSATSRTMQTNNSQTYLFRVGDPVVYRQWGVRMDDPAQLPPGRGFAIPTGLEIQMATPEEGLEAAIQAATTTDNPHLGDAGTPAKAQIVHSRAGDGGPEPVECLGALISADQLDEARLDDQLTYLPLGISDATLSPVGLTLYTGEHALILGPARSGRTSALALIATSVAKAGGTAIVLGSTNSPLANSKNISMWVEDANELLASAQATQSNTVVLIDDVEMMLDPNGSLAALIAKRDLGLHIVAAGSSDRLRTAYGHWSTQARYSRTGVLLQPHPLDGDYFHVQLPTQPVLPKLPGRGYLVQSSTSTILQVAHMPSDA
ncbi:MAG: hypothetical protein F4138_02860 [Acidimicrobiia bacterium]|nr:hypothetical protein [Acidimicrobiia bacterium]